MTHGPLRVSKLNRRAGSREGKYVYLLCIIKDSKTWKMCLVWRSKVVRRNRVVYHTYKWLGGLAK